MITASTEKLPLSIRELVARVKNGAKIENCRIVGSLNHETLAEILEFDPQARQYSCKYRVQFDGCELQDIDLRSTHFTEDFEARRCSIGRCVFSYAHFHKSPNFSTTVFQTEASFYRARFDWPAYFSDTQFKDEALFGLCDFADSAHFNNADFGQKGCFSGTHFRSACMFIRVSFHELELEHVRAHGPLRISTGDSHNVAGSKVSGRGLMAYDHVDCNALKCETLDISEMKAKDCVELSEASFERLGLWGARIAALHVRLEQLWTRKQVGSLRAGYRLLEQTDLDRLRDMLLFLKSNFQQLGMRDEEDWAYCEIRSVELLKDFRSRRFLRWFVGRTVLDRGLGFGTKPWRAFASSVGLIVMFGLVYGVAGVRAASDSDLGPLCGIQHPVKFLECIYFSAITFTTVGFGDITPDGWRRAIAAIEGFVGVFMMSAFTVTFSRKLLR